MFGITYTYQFLTVATMKRTSVSSSKKYYRFIITCFIRRSLQK